MVAGLRFRPAHVYFDGGESFMHPFRKRWQQEMRSQRLRPLQMQPSIRKSHPLAWPPPP